MNIRTKVPSLGVVIITKVWMASLVPGLHLLLVKSVGDVDGLVRPAMQWPPWPGVTAEPGWTNKSGSAPPYRQTGKYTQLLTKQVN